MTLTTDHGATPTGVPLNPLVLINEDVTPITIRVQSIDTAGGIPAGMDAGRIRIILAQINERFAGRSIHLGPGKKRELYQDVPHEFVPLFVLSFAYTGGNGHEHEKTINAY